MSNNLIHNKQVPIKTPFVPDEVVASIDYGFDSLITTLRAGASWFGEPPPGGEDVDVDPTSEARFSGVLSVAADWLEAIGEDRLRGIQAK